MHQCNALCTNPKSSSREITKLTETIAYAIYIYCKLNNCKPVGKNGYGMDWKCEKNTWRSGFVQTFQDSLFLGVNPLENNHPEINPRISHS